MTSSDSEAVVREVIYVFTNPVEAGLVPCIREWPGARSLPGDMWGASRTVRRPQVFFREHGLAPAAATLELTPPPGMDLSQNELEERLAQKQRSIRESMRAKGRKFMGRRRVFEQSPWSGSITREARSGLKPTFATRSRWRRIEALQRKRAFLESYQSARRRFIEGDRNAVFPC
ncbi:MAG: hypothetical protein AAF639_35665, partial [Chloroflexota bacterium]